MKLLLHLSMLNTAEKYGENIVFLVVKRISLLIMYKMDWLKWIAYIWCAFYGQFD